MNIIDLTKEKLTEVDNISELTKSSIECLSKEPLEKLLFAKSDKYITPFAIIAVSNSPKQIDAIASSVIKNLKEKSLFNTKIRIDGNGERGWCIIDLSDCLLNIMIPEKFDKYAIEKILKGDFSEIEELS